MKNSLTPRQARFVEEYLIDLNATQAAIRAGYSPKGATVEGTRLLTNTNIARAITEAQKQRAKQVKISQNEVLRRYWNLATGDIRRVVEWGPGRLEVRDSKQLTPDEAALVSEVSETRVGNRSSVRVKFADKLAALRDVAKHVGMFVDQMNITANREALAILLGVMGEIDPALRAKVQARLRRLEGEARAMIPDDQNLLPEEIDTPARAKLRQ
jgi:phage terminase small subunit